MIFPMTTALQQDILSQVICGFEKRLFKYSNFDLNVTRPGSGSGDDLNSTGKYGWTSGGDICTAVDS